MKHSQLPPNKRALFYILCGLFLAWGVLYVSSIIVALADVRPLELLRHKDELTTRLAIVMSMSLVTFLFLTISAFAAIFTSVLAFTKRYIGAQRSLWIWAIGFTGFMLGANLSTIPLGGTPSVSIHVMAVLIIDIGAFLMMYGFIKHFRQAPVPQPIQ